MEEGITNEPDIVDNTYPRFEMYSKEAETKALLEASLFGGGFVLLIILPWAIGWAMLIKCIIF